VIVTVEKLEGLNKAKGVVRTVDSGVDRVYVDGVCVGIIGRQEGAAVCFTEAGIDPELREKIRQEVASQREVATAPHTVAPPVVPEEYTEEEEEPEDPDYEDDDE